MEAKYRELIYKIIGVYYDVYNELGHGFLESVYQKSLAWPCNRQGSTPAGQSPSQSGSEANKWASLRRICSSKSAFCSN
jgi:GxxExxY protein